MKRELTEAYAPEIGDGVPTPRDLSPEALGQRIKMLRIARGFTLKDLEERGGVSATHVSEIERGKASPTIGAFARIAQALGVRPAELLEPRVLPDMAVMRAGERAARRLSAGGGALEPLCVRVEGAGIAGLLVTLPPGPGPVLAHHHEGEEWVTVLAGLAEVVMAERRWLLREGDSLHFRAHCRHAFANPASAPATVLVGMRPPLVL